MKIVIFNGPANSGKDEAVNYFKKKYGSHPFSFKTHLKAATLLLFQISESVWDSWYTREGKELKREELGNRSCREALIFVSETVIKPNFGKGYFGEVESKKIFYLGDVFVSSASDGGFNEEVEPFVPLFGTYNVHVVRIVRPGCSFDGDSRNWIDTHLIPNENYQTIHNDGTLEEFYQNLSDAYDYIVR